MNWLLITISSIVLLGLVGGGLYYYIYVYKKSCCPDGFNQDYRYSVHVAAGCDKDNKSKPCKRCIGEKEPPKDWKNKVERYQGGIYVTDPQC